MRTVGPLLVRSPDVDCEAHIGCSTEDHSPLITSPQDGRKQMLGGGVVEDGFPAPHLGSGRPTLRIEYDLHEELPLWQVWLRRGRQAGLSSLHYAWSGNRDWNHHNGCCLWRPTGPPSTRVGVGSIGRRWPGCTADRQTAEERERQETTVGRVRSHSLPQVWLTVSIQNSRIRAYARVTGVVERRKHRRAG